jgi:DNA-binding NarL/FixJ family response regulator
MTSLVGYPEAERGEHGGGVAFGPDAALEAIAAMVDGIREGIGGALVIRGQVGIPTSALLERAVDAAPDLEVARAAGVTSEMELGFAGVHQLVGPYVARLERLPAPQRDALGSALGLREGGSPHRFLVGLGVLSLLAEVATERPLLCVVDAFQWLDPDSADVLAFAARRLCGRRIGLLIVVDEESELGGLAGLPGLRLAAPALIPTTSRDEEVLDIWQDAPSPAIEMAVIGEEAPAPDPIRVMIVDDHRMVAEGLRLFFHQHDDLQVVGIAGDAEEGLRLASVTSPDVVLVDSRLPDATGAELATRIREIRRETRVLLLGTMVSAPLLQEAVKAGARGYLLITQAAEELVDAVRRATAGEMLIPATALAELVTGGDGPLPLDPLTAREQQILRLLAEGLDNRGIAGRLGIGYVTVRSHLRNLSSKLDAHSKLEIVARARDLGLI